MPITINKMPAKYRQVEKELRGKIHSGLWPPGQRLPGEHELAKSFGVAYMTLRQAIACLIDEGLLLRINGKGTFVADQAAPEQLVRQRRPMALLIPSSGINKDGYYFPDLLSGFQTVTDGCDVNIMSYNGDASEPPSLLLPGSAIACLLTRVSHYAMVERLRDSGFPVLAINRYSGRRAIPCVRIDDSRGIEMAVEYLVGLGHRKIGFVRAVSFNIDAQDRLRGFRAAVRRHALPAGIEAGDDFTEEAGYDAARRMLSSAQPPTAIVCASDLSAIGALQAARDFGLRLPEDLSIVGFGDFSIGNYAAPRLTTIRQHRVLLGQKAAENLLKLANDEQPSNLVIPAELIVRESTAAPRGAGLEPITAIAKIRKPRVKAVALNELLLQKK